MHPFHVEQHAHLLMNRIVVLVVSSSYKYTIIHDEGCIALLRHDERLLGTRKCCQAREEKGVKLSASSLTC